MKVVLYLVVLNILQMCWIIWITIAPPCRAHFSQDHTLVLGAFLSIFAIHLPDECIKHRFYLRHLTFFIKHRFHLLHWFTIISLETGNKINKNSHNALAPKFIINYMSTTQQNICSPLYNRRHVVRDDWGVHRGPACSPPAHLSLLSARSGCGVVRVKSTGSPVLSRSPFR